jgi:bifunctional non-homologous end joining protein LigD
LRHAPGAIRLVKTAKTTKEKRALLEQLRVDNAEGIVFKRHDAPYVAGRPSTGGPQLKFKFTTSATCKVVKRNENKRSVALALWDGDEWVSVGNVTISANQTIPKAKALVEVKYLYAYKGGSLIQPVYLGERDDCGEESCTIEQLKYKREVTDDDDE